MIEFETAKFECELSKSNLKVTWKKDGVPLEWSKHFDMVTMGNKYILTVREAELEDQAKYTIVAEEGVEATAGLTVKGTEIN